MKYNIKKNKNLIISSSILAGINCNNIYCGCLCGDEKNKQTTGDGKEKKDETPNGGEGEKKLTPEEIEQNRKKFVNNLMNLFNDKKEKLQNAKKLDELKITEEQIRNVNSDKDFQNIINELNKFAFHNIPETDVKLDIDNIHDEPYIFKLSDEDNLKRINFNKYINDDIFENNDEKIKEITGNLFKQNKLFHFMKYDPSMFVMNEENLYILNKEYYKNNVYFLYIDKNTFSIKDGVELEEIPYAVFKSKIISNPKIFENCYILFSLLEKDDETVTVFKKKTFIDLDNLDSYPNIVQVESSESKENLLNKLKIFIKNLYKLELNTEKDIADFLKNKEIDVEANGKKFGIFNSTIDEIEFKGYKKLTTKPDDYGTIDEKEKFEINIKDLKGNITTYYFVKEKAK